MRLVCPNCGAQYAVDDSVIPEAGRDVQCSNCGHTWFQAPEGGVAGASTAARIASQPGPRHETTKIDTAGAPAAAPQESERTPRKALDSAVMDVLREEAEREKAARAAEAPRPPAPEPASEAAPAPDPAPVSAPEPVPAPSAEAAPEAVPAPDPQPAPPTEHEVEAESHKARMRGEHPVPAVAALSGKSAQRSDMLPDIDEINSTLRASADPSRAQEEPGVAEAARKNSRRGFRMGFGMMVIIALVLALLYAQGPRLAAEVPAVSGPVTSYVAAVDDGRRWLDDLLRGAGAE